MGGQGFHREGAKGAKKTFSGLKSFAALAAWCAVCASPPAFSTLERGARRATGLFSGSAANLIKTNRNDLQKCSG